MKNENMRLLIQELKKKSIDEKVNIWRRIALDLDGPSRKRRAVNLSRINRCAKADESVVVPGKVLSSGELDKKINITAYSFSQKAREKIEQVGGKAFDLTESIAKNPKGKGMRIIG